MKIVKAVIINILSIILTGLLGYLSLFLFLELNYFGLVISLILLAVYISLLCFFRNRIFSGKFIVGFKFITLIFWLFAFLIFIYLDNNGFCDNQMFGGITEFLISALSVIISVLIFICINIIFFVKHRRNKKLS